MQKRSFRLAVAMEQTWSFVLPKISLNWQLQNDNQLALNEENNFDKQYKGLWTKSVICFNGIYK